MVTYKIKRQLREKHTQIAIAKAMEARNLNKMTAPMGMVSSVYI